MPETPDLTGRVARCSCGRTAPSSPALAFFIYWGPGNTQHNCGVCGYTPRVHEDTPEHIVRHASWTPHTWVPSEREHDEYYCGCRGWD